MKRLLMIGMSVLLLCGGATWAGPLEDADAAYVRNDYSTAFRIFGSLAAQGHARAQYNLGAMYVQGHGVAQDYAEAAKWFRLAAAQGDAEAKSNLAVMYAQGKGVSQDNGRALMWAILSAVSGDADMVKKRDIIAKRMTPQQIAQAQKMANDCQQRKFKGCD
jgi:hypothetical protein